MPNSEEHSLHPIIIRTLSWFSSNHSNTTWHASDWWHNNTFDYEEFNEDIADATTGLEDQLHPASDVDVNGVLTSTIFNTIVFVGLTVTYEILRRYFPYVYATRQSREEAFNSRQENEGHEGDEGDDKKDSDFVPSVSAQKLPDLYQSNTPLEWVKPVFGITWRQVRETGGLDAYFFLRYIRMCFRITSVSAFWGMIILFPIFARGNNNAVGWYHFSMANVAQGSNLIWVPTVFMYLFSCFVLFSIKLEYKHYVDLRENFLGKGDGSSDPQHHYSIMVEQIPVELRSENALYDYFDQMFPGRVHSTNVILSLPELEKLSMKKLKVTRRLEKSIAHFEATGNRPDHVVGRPRLMLCGVELAPLGGCRNKSSVVMDFDENDDTISKGEKVDSINYYTHLLRHLNKELFLLQKNKRDIAEFGNQSSTAQSWFSHVSRIAEYFMDDPGIDDSDDDSMSPSALWLKSSTRGEAYRSQARQDHQNALLIPPPTSAITVGRGDGLIMDENTGVTDGSSTSGNLTDLESHHDNGTYSSPKSSNGSNNNPSSTGYGSLDDTSPRIKKKRRFFKNLKRKKRGVKGTKGGDAGSSSSKEEPLIPHHDNDSQPEKLPPIGILRNRRAASGIARTSQTSCIEDDEVAKKVSKIAGRFGLDFGAYALKLVNRVLYRTIDDETTNVMSRTGFVTFLDLGSVTCVASAPLTQKPNTLEVAVAPEARDIIWKNSHYTTDFLKRRENNANNFLALGALLWSIPLAFIQGISSAENVAHIPGMEWILEYDNGNLALFINAYLPVVALLGLILILPVIFEWVARSYEKRKTHSEVQKSLVSRYFYYQLANIYISVTAGSLLKSAADILARPSAGLEILGNSLPTVVGYFISLIITKILAGLPMVILRVGALSRYLLLRLLTRDKFLTQHELDRVYRSEPLLYGWEYPTQLLVIVICFTYACISPVILVFGALYFIGALMVYKKQVLYVYSPSYESGGSLFPLVCDRTIIGLICGQLTFIGYSIIRGGHYQPLALVPLVYFSIWTMGYFNRHYAEPSKRLSLERAMELDKHVSSLERVSSPQRQDVSSMAPKDSFSSEHYKQPVLAEKYSVPLFYRSGQEDPLTLDARRKLVGGERASMWYPRRESDIEDRRREGSIVV